MVTLELDLWLKPEEVQPESVLKFLNAGENSEIPQGEGKEPTPTFEIGVSLPNGDIRKWTMNKTSQRAVAQAYGTDTNNWVGKSVSVFISTQNVSGKMKQVIYARVPE